MDLAVNFLDPQKLILAFGVAGILAIIFAETGLLFGCILPGDSLLFAAGIFTVGSAAQGLGLDEPLSLPVLLVGGPLCAIAGAQLGHWLGARYGRKLFDRPDSRIFRQEWVDKAEYYFEKFGPAKAVVLARFIPIVRTFLNPLAGMLGMDARKFFLWNVIGGVLWTDGLFLAGHFLGSKIPNIETYILPGIFVIILLSVIPILREVLKARSENRRAGNKMAAEESRPSLSGDSSR
ncbi:MULTISPECIES: DedA family protein [Thermomonospora]|uniref:Membrane-associated protein n=1 Tax=Thermomonospora cellulosilytica TaxID=1411118 RepID=A0A7W3MV16_9ACTN|nr:MULTISPECIES: DedA family protein [Thermomonospora]MBA9002426.1 membrane-associated protein [Thermomonospora cellulosilytica]